MLGTDWCLKAVVGIPLLVADLRTERTTSGVFGTWRRERRVREYNLSNRNP